MTTLRVLIDAVPAAHQAFDYAVTDDTGTRVVRRSRGDATQWPRADRAVAIVAAPLLFAGTLKLPPIAAARLDDAVRYALDDQLAAAPDSMHIAHGAQQKDGRVRAFAMARELMRAIVAQVPNVTRIVAEPALFPADAQWHWTIDARGRGFLLRADASAVAVQADAVAPPEIALAVSQARRTSTLPARIVAHASSDAGAPGIATIDGVDVVRGETWSWDGSGRVPADVDAAPDLRQGEFVDPALRRDRGSTARMYRPALAVAATALALLAMASVGTWLYDSADAWRDQRAAIAMARTAGVDGGADFASAMAAITQRYADARHAARAAAPTDALPLLARAAPALAALPAGKWKRAVYSSGAWTLEFSAIDDATRDTLIRRLTDAGLTALSATNPGGLRVRIQI
ncbi:MAG: type II secretion system protein GspL [Betaproteobacteria bacterium]